MLSALDPASFTGLITAIGAFVIGFSTLIFGELRERRKERRDTSPLPPVAELPVPAGENPESVAALVKELTEERRAHDKTRTQLAECQRRLAMTVEGAGEHKRTRRTNDKD